MSRRRIRVNVRDGTNAGPWQTYVYKLVNDRTQPEPVTFDNELKDAIATLPRCDANTSVNLALLAWLQDGREMLLVAETPILESCKNKKGDRKGFRVSKDTGKILERLNRKTFAEKWPKESACLISRD